MKKFFLKKNIFAFCFLCFLLVFSITNVIYGREELLKLGNEVLKVETPDELKDWILDAEDTVNDKILGQKNFIEGYGYFQKLAGKREFNSFSFVKGKNDMMYYGSVWNESTDDLEEYARRVYYLKNYVESKGAKLLVVLPPPKILSGKTTVDLCWPINDPNDRMDEFLNWLRKYQIPAADLRICLERSGLELEELFFKTDRHWTPLAAFYATGEVVRQIEGNSGEDLDPQDVYCSIDSYNQYTYQNVMLGFMGRNTGVVYSGVEDYTLLWPKFDTFMTFTDYEEDKIRSGTFTESVMDARSLKVTDWYKSNVNDVYINGIHDRSKIVNHINTDAPRIAGIVDSYFAPMACFLSPMCSELDMIWYKIDDAEQIDAFIFEDDYDYLILEVYPYNLDEGPFRFFQNKAS